MAMLKKFSIKNDILPRLLSEEFTERYFNGTKFRTYIKWKNITFYCNC